MTVRIKWFAPVGLFAIGAALVSCGGSSDASGAATQIQALPSLAFSPPVVGVTAGASVTWVFSSVGDNVIFDAVDGRPADITGTNANTSISRVFGTAGTFNFHSGIHPAMTGSVHVSAPSNNGYLTTP